MTVQYIIRADQDFRGNAQSVLNTDGTVAYTNGLTLAQYAAECNFPLKVVTSIEMMKLADKYEDTLITAPRRITKERFWDMLEILPPCRWHTVTGFEVFHVSERLTGDLVSWFAERDGKYWEFTNRASLTDAQLSDILIVRS